MMGPISVTVSGSVGVSTAIQLDYLKYGALAVQTTASSTTSVYAIEVSLSEGTSVAVQSTGMIWTSLGTSTSVGNNIVTATAPYRWVRLNVTTGASQATTTMTVIQSG